MKIADAFELLMLMLLLAPLVLKVVPLPRKFAEDPEFVNVEFWPVMEKVEP